MSGGTQARGLFRGAMLLTSATALAQLIALSAAPLITRLYTPEQFGLYAVFAAVVAIGTVVACLRYELAIILPESFRQAVSVLKLSLISTVLVALVSLVLLVIFGSDLADWVGVEERYLLLLIAPTLLLIGIYRAGSYWLIRKRSYAPLAAAKLSQSIPQTLAQVGFGFAGLGSVGLVAGDIVGRVTGNAMLWLRITGGRRAVRPSITGKELKSSAVRYRAFPLVSSWSAITNEVGSMAPALLLAGLFGPAVAGSYALGRRILAAPLDLIGQSVAAVFTGEASRLARENPGGLRTLYVRFVSRLFLVGVLPTILLTLYGEEFFVLIFGENWSDAGRYAQILSTAYLFRFAISPLGQMLNILEKQALQLVWDGCRVVALLSALLIPYALSLPVEYALLAYTGALVAAQIIHVMIVLRQVRVVARIGR